MKQPNEQYERRSSGLIVPKNVEVVIERKQLAERVAVTVDHPAVRQYIAALNNLSDAERSLVGPLKLD